VAGNSADTGRSVTSKVIAILLTFTNGSSYSLTEIARLSGLPISTAHRLSTELAAWGILERTDDAQYRVGLPLKVIGSHASHASSMLERARQVMEDLSTATRTCVRLGVLDGVDVAYIEKNRSGRPVSALHGPPAVVPAHATAMGKALLAFSSARTVDMVIAAGLKRYTPFTLTTADGLRRALAVTRLTRVATARREFDARTSTIAVPVFGAGGAVVSALELDIRDSHSELRLLQPALSVAARSLSRDLATSRTRGVFMIGPDRVLTGHANGHINGHSDATDRAADASGTRRSG